MLTGELAIQVKAQVPCQSGERPSVFPVDWLQVQGESAMVLMLSARPTDFASTYTFKYTFYSIPLYLFIFSPTFISFI